MLESPIVDVAVGLSVPSVVRRSAAVCFAVSLPRRR